jgi:hypothetical protein
MEGCEYGTWSVILDKYKNALTYYKKRFVIFTINITNVKIFF